MKLQEIDTLQDLKIWVGENMQGATVEEGEGGIVIRTGLASAMGGYLHPVEREGECDKCANPYEISSKEGRCGDCGNCGDCCTHNEREGE
jgi:PHP family Zn ribbon phosphoesterase